MHSAHLFRNFWRVGAGALLSQFKLSPQERSTLLSEYLAHCESVELVRASSLRCRDKNDQPFLELAECGNADIIVTGDNDLLALREKTVFQIETPEAYRLRTSRL